MRSHSRALCAGDTEQLGKPVPFVSGAREHDHVIIVLVRPQLHVGRTADAAAALALGLVFLAGRRVGEHVGHHLAEARLFDVELFKQLPLGFDVFNRHRAERVVSCEQFFRFLFRDVENQHGYALIEVHLRSHVAVDELEPAALDFAGDAGAGIANFVEDRLQRFFLLGRMLAPVPWARLQVAGAHSYEVDYAVPN